MLSDNKLEYIMLNLEHLPSIQDHCNLWNLWNVWKVNCIMAHSRALQYLHAIEQKHIRHTFMKKAFTMQSHLPSE